MRPKSGARWSKWPTSSLTDPGMSAGIIHDLRSACHVWFGSISSFRPKPSHFQSTVVNRHHQTGRLVRATCDICGSSSRSEPMSLVNIELHRAFVMHLQEERLAVVRMLYVHALHDFESFQRLFTKGN